MSINGNNNNFNPTIDGLINFDVNSLTCDSLTVNTSISLPNNSILDQYLSNNIPKKNEVNTYTEPNIFYNGVTIYKDFILYNQAIFDNYLSPNVCLLDAVQTLANKTIDSGIFIGTSVFDNDVTLDNSNLTIDNGFLILKDGSNESTINQTGTDLYILNNVAGGSIAFSAVIPVSPFTITPLIINSSGLLCDSITLNLSENIYLSGTGIISQTGTGNNELKATNFTGNVTLQSSDIILQSGNVVFQSANSAYFYNTTNTLYTEISQNSSTLKITNPNTPGGVEFEVNDIFDDLYTYRFSATSFSCPVDIVLLNNSLRLTDGTTTTSRTNFIHTGGDCLIENREYSGEIILRTRNAVLDDRDFVISYNGITSNSLLTCNSGLTVGSPLTLYNNAILDSYLTSNVPLKNGVNTFSKNNIFKTIQFTNSESLKHITLYQRSATNLTQNYTISVENETIRYNIENGSKHLFSVGTISAYTSILKIDNDGLTLIGHNINQSSTDKILQTGTGINIMKNIEIQENNNLTQSGVGIISQTGTGNNSLKATTIMGALTCNGNIILPTTFTAPTGGQLGYKFLGTTIASFLVTGNVVFQSASILLPVGVWNVFGQSEYYIRTAGTLETSAVSLSLNNLNVDYDICDLTINNNSMIGGGSIVKRINNIFTSSGSTTIYLMNLLQYFSPLVVDHSSNNTNIYAVRIA
jgi:hypothetical protein